MEFPLLGLIHPEWDTEIEENELSVWSAPCKITGTIHGLSPTLYNHLPHNVKVQLALQQKRIDILSSKLIVRLQETLSETAVEGGCFYNEGVGRDLSALCKAIERSESKFLIAVPRLQRQALIRELFDFVTRHANPSLVYHPKALRASASLLIAFLAYERTDAVAERTYASFQQHNLVPKVEFHFPTVSLDWRAMYDFARTAFKLNNDRRCAEHYYGSAPIAEEVLDELLQTSRFFYPKDSCNDMFPTIFPLLFAKPGSTLLSLPNETLKTNTELVDYMCRQTKDDDLLLASVFLPLPLPDTDTGIDYEQLVEQLIFLWSLVPDSLAWDRMIVSMLTDISRHKAIRWKPNQVRIVLSCPGRQLKLATAGTPLATPGRSSSSPTIATSRPLGTLLGNLLVNILSSDIEFENAKGTPLEGETATGVILQWFLQIEGYLHPNSTVPGARALKNILVGVVAELKDRFRAANAVKDYERFANSIKNGAQFSTESQGIYDFLNLPFIEVGTIEDYIIKESTWDAILPILDRFRVHLVDSSLYRDMSFLLAHIRPNYIHSSIFPRIFYALENPMLGGHIQVPSAMKTLAAIVPLLVTVPGAPTRLADILTLLLDHVDPNDVKKTAETFNLVTALMMTMSERKRGKNASESPTRQLKDIEEIVLPSELATTLVGKSFNELKMRLLHKTPSCAYEPPLLAKRNDASEKEDNIDQSNLSAELESELLLLENALSDWVVEFFERILGFIDGVPKGSASSSSLVHCVKESLEFCTLIGDSLFDILLRSLTRAVCSSPRAKTDLNALIDAFTRVRPQLVLHACFDSWFTDVKKRGQKSKSKQVESESELMAWKLDLLRLIIKRSGAPIGTHEKALLSIVEPLLDDEDKMVRRAAVHVLPAALGPMKQSYNIRTDPAATGKFNTFVDILINHAIFVEPTPFSLEQAAKWSTQFVSPVISIIKEATDQYKKVEAPQETTNKSKNSEEEKNPSQQPSQPAPVASHATVPASKDLAEKLHLVCEFLAVLGPVLPISKHEFSNVPLSVSQHLSLAEQSPAITNELVAALTESAVIKHKQGLIPPPLSVLTHATRESKLPNALKTLRWEILEAIQEFVAEAILTGKCYEPKIVRRSLKVFAQTLVHNGAKELKFADKISRLTSKHSHSSSESAEGSTEGTKSKSKQRKEASVLEASVKGSLRVAYLGRDLTSPLHPYFLQTRLSNCSFILNARWSSARNKLVFGTSAAALVRAYVTLSSNHLELIRSAKLAKLFLENVPRFGGSIAFLNNLLLRAISQPLAPNQSLLSFAALPGILSSSFALPNLVANWKNFGHFISVLKGLHIHDHALLQKLIDRLYTSVMEQLPLRAATPLQDKGFFFAYADLMDSLVTDLTAKSTEVHWRYHLYTIITMCAVLRRNVHTPGLKQIEREVAKNLISSDSQSSQAEPSNSTLIALQEDPSTNLSSSKEMLAPSEGPGEGRILSSSAADSQSERSALVSSSTSAMDLFLAPKSSLSGYRPGLDGVAVMKALLPVLTDVLPTARKLARFALSKLAKWAQDSEDCSHAEVLAPLLEEEQFNAILNGIVIDRQTAHAESNSLDLIAKNILLSDSHADFYGIGDTEFGFGSEVISQKTFVFRIADFWYRLFSSIKYSTGNRHESIESIATLLFSKVVENLTANSSSASASRNAEKTKSVSSTSSSIKTEVSDTPDVLAPSPLAAGASEVKISSASPASQDEQNISASPQTNTPDPQDSSKPKTPTESSESKASKEKKPNLKVPAKKKPSSASPASPSPEFVDEMEDYFFCLVEAMAGFTRAFPEIAQEKVWVSILNGARLSTHRLSSILLSIAYLTHYKVSLDTFETSLLEPIMKQDASSVELNTQNVFDTEARLYMVLFLYQESRYAKLESLAKLVQRLFIAKGVAALPKPQIRNVARHLLALLSALLTRSPYANDSTTKHALKIHDETIEMLLESVKTEENTEEGGIHPSDDKGAPNPQSAAPSVISVSATTTATGSMVPVTPQDRVKSTLIAWVSDCLDQRIEILVQPKWWSKLTQSLLDLSVDASSAVSKSSAKELLRLSQLAVLPVSELEEVETLKQIEIIKRLVSSNPRWKARETMHLVLIFFAFNHAILLPLSERSDIIEWAKHLVEDSHVAVRKAATGSLSSLIRSLCPSDEQMSQIVSHFLGIASKNQAKARSQAREAKDDAPSASLEAVNILVSAVAGLSALASSCPYTIPPWLPDVIIGLQRLSTHSNGTVASLASDSIVQFWKTHRDEWVFHQTHFSAEQLRILADKPVPSYYA